VLQQPALASAVYERLGQSYQYYLQPKERTVEPTKPIVGPHHCKRQGHFFMGACSSMFKANICSMPLRLMML
jgi:hypothetical protein